MKQLSAPLTKTYAHVLLSAATSGSARPLHAVDGHWTAAPIPVCHEGRETPGSQPPPEPFHAVSLVQLPDPSMLRFVPPTARTNWLTASAERPTAAPLSPVEKTNVFPVAAPCWDGLSMFPSMPQPWQEKLLEMIWMLEFAASFSTSSSVELLLSWPSQ